eukprot:TRINITY_DN10588_c0_g2_i4.p2 TRINITY_DN10588_c0_g2~~TRINITY_DN10588_c0_g2_i4.p2  ORF type:complete len:140 (-),score=20.09 TRINITY_DN10588_c0_g2_i4:59-478(-)
MLFLCETILFSFIRVLQPTNPNIFAVGQIARLNQPLGQVRTGGRNFKFLFGCKNLHLSMGQLVRQGAKIQESRIQKSGITCQIAVMLSEKKIFTHIETTQSLNILSSGQTLGVKAQRFRGHTSPHRNVKEKKKIGRAHV